VREIEQSLEPIGGSHNPGIGAIAFTLDHKCAYREACGPGRILAAALAYGGSTTVAQEQRPESNEVRPQERWS
jgi:hypothetical protein